MIHLTIFLCKAYFGGHLTICLALGGCTNWPIYRIVAVDKCLQDGRFVEQLDSYDSLPTIMEKNWLPSTWTGSGIGLAVGLTS
ncbi:28S ribosomal protein S16, mitochondrial [Sigmodon hispidus]